MYSGNGNTGESNLAQASAMITHDARVLVVKEGQCPTIALGNAEKRWLVANGGPTLKKENKIITKK